jgi:hypothetical protein
VSGIPTNKQMIAAAQLEWEDEGSLEFDDEPAISRSADNEDAGAYVQCWVWVYDKDAIDLETPE